MSEHIDFTCPVKDCGHITKVLASEAVGELRREGKTDGGIVSRNCEKCGAEISKYVYIEPPHG